VDKKRCWRALSLTMWFNENSDFYYNLVHGDKETFHLAFRKLKQDYSLVPKGIHSLFGTMCQHDFSGQRIFQHRTRDKWDLFNTNRSAPGFYFEKECRASIVELQRLWDGRVSRVPDYDPKKVRSGVKRSRPLIEAMLISTPQRNAARAATLENLRKTDWVEKSVQLVSGHDESEKAVAQATLAALKQYLSRSFDFVVLLKDDCQFNHCFLHNLSHWDPLRKRKLAIASLHNPRVVEIACDVPNRVRIVAAKSMKASQAYVLSRATVRKLVRWWRRLPGNLDTKISRLAARLKHPVLYHVPSLVQSDSTTPKLGNKRSRTVDFDADWKA